MKADLQSGSGFNQSIIFMRKCKAKIFLIYIFKEKCMFKTDTNQSPLEEWWKKEISCTKEKQEIPEKFQREEGEN